LIKHERQLGGAQFIAIEKLLKVYVTQIVYIFDSCVYIEQMVESIMHAQLKLDWIKIG